MMIFISVIDNHNFFVIICLIACVDTFMWWKSNGRDRSSATGLARRRLMAFCKSKAIDKSISNRRNTYDANKGQGHGFLCAQRGERVLMRSATERQSIVDAFKGAALVVRCA